jgi:hypothetical protein
MKYIILLVLVSLTGITTFSQIPEDALKYSWSRPTGTARVQAIGGAVGSLGGDITSNFVNPAGLAFFKTNDFVITPGFSMLKNKNTYRGDVTDGGQKNAFSLGTSGAVFGFNNKYSKWNGRAFSIAVSQTANFNNSIAYSGKNNFSSYGEQYAAEVDISNLSLDDAINSPSLSFQARMAIYSFLVDTLTIPGNAKPDVVSLALWNNLKNNAAFKVNQQHTIETKGGITEIAIGFAATNQDKLYLGGSIGIPIVNYEKHSTFRETDTTGNANNNFNYSELTETSTTKGVGVNIKLGLIFKPVEQLRLGLAIHSPTMYGLKDTYDATMTTDVEEYVPYADRPTYKPHTTTVNVGTLNNSQIASYKYDLLNPWRVLVSGSYVLSEVEDVKKQKGFITADIEYVNYKSNKYSIADENGDNSYYDDVNKAIKDYYKGAFNFRVGGELKFNTIMARLGFAYNGNPYKDSELKGNKMFISGGLGYRNKGMFIDLAYVLGLTRDVSFPYRLPDKANTFALVKGNGGNIAVTAGFKF